ncbi:MAG: glycosyltransferase family 39 protein [Proteobacteria bacterium]|nr:glycosyltransferase family 39 protein [Pseudomonadota bacterium]MBU1451646.1 glycosyltransferase family 39 protein [Pseudomonadota bacterium]
MLATEDKKRTPALWIAGLLLLAMAVRGLFFLAPTLDADQAVVGLMGMDILQGRLPLMFWGQDYGGSLESIVAAGFFALLGVSRQSLYLSPTFMSMFYLWAVYLIGRDLWGRRAGLTALFLASLGPFYLIWHSVLPRAIYIDTLALGVWLIWVTLKALRRQPGTRSHAWLCAAFGLMAGVAIWCHMLAVYFILPCALVWWRRDPRLVIRPAFALMVAAFSLGSAPLWWHNLVTDWSTYYFMFHPKPKEPFWQSLTFIWQRSLPVLLGAHHFALVGKEAVVAPGLSQAVLGLTGAAALAGLLVWGKNLLKRLVWGDKGDGSELLLLTAATVVLVFGAMGLSSSGTHRYLVPLYAVWPLLLAWAFCRLIDLGQAAKLLAWGGLGAVAALLAVGVYQVSPLGDPSLKPRYESQVSLAREMADFLARKGVTHAYVSQYWVAPVLSFDCRKKVVFVVSRKDRNPAFERGLLRAKRFALCEHGPGDSGMLRTTLQSLGASFAEEEIRGWRLFYDVAAPPDHPQVASPASWRLEAEPNPLWSPRAADYNASLGWRTGQGQKPGQRLVVDLGKITSGVCQVLLFNGMAEDAPHRILVRGSSDGQTWDQLVEVEGLPVPFAWTGGDKLVALRFDNWQELRFPPHSLRYLRLEQTGHRPRWNWSVLEVLVGAAGAPRPDPQAAAAWLRGELGPQTRIWCPPGLAAWLPEGMRTRPHRHPQPSWLPDYLRAPWLLPDDRRLYFACETGRASYALEALASAGWQSEHRAAHGYTLIIADPPPAPAAAGPGRQVTPRREGQALVADLGGSQRVGSMELVPPEGQALSLAGLRLELSRDGAEYTPAPARALWPGRLYWAGLAPMAAMPGPVRLELDPTETRYLRLSRQGPPLPPGLTLRISTAEK